MKQQTDILEIAKDLEFKLFDAREAKQPLLILSLECMIECAIELNQISRCDGCYQLNEDSQLIGGECSNCNSGAHHLARHEQQQEDEAQNSK